MTEIRMVGRGLRGESFGDIARRQGSIGSTTVPSTATDAEVLALLSSDFAQIVAAAPYTIIAEVLVATTANITLSGAQTIDGVAVVAGNDVLVKNQSSGAQDGIYVAASGSWSRRADFDSSGEVVTGSFVRVLNGDTQAGAWVLVTTGTITVGTTAQVWNRFDIDALAVLRRPGGSGNVGFQLPGSGPVAVKVEDKLGEVVSVFDFMTAAQIADVKSGSLTLDVSAAFQAALDYNPAGGSSGDNAGVSVYFPPGVYRLVTGLNITRNFLTLRGAGMDSVLYFDPSSAGQSMLLAQSADPADLAKFITLQDFSYAADITNTVKKIAIAISDGSAIKIDNVWNLDYSWTGNGSIALSMNGRDSHGISNCAFTADFPVYIDTNPNSDQFQADFITFRSVLFQTLDPDNYAVTVAPGVNLSSFTIDWGCAALMGKGGFYHSNQGTPTTYPSTLVTFNGFRCEAGPVSGGAADGYGIYFDPGDANPKAGNVTINVGSVNDPDCNGYYIRNTATVNAQNVNCGFGPTNNAFILERCLNATVIGLGIGDDDATVLFDDMYETLVVRPAEHFSNPTNPSVAFGLYTHWDTDTANRHQVFQNGMRVWGTKVTVGNSGGATLPSVPDAASSMIVDVSCALGTARWHVKNGAATLLAATGSGDFGVAGGGKITVIEASGAVSMTNVSAGTQTLCIETRGT